MQSYGRATSRRSGAAPAAVRVDCVVLGYVVFIRKFQKVTPNPPRNEKRRPRRVPRPLHPRSVCRIRALGPPKPRPFARWRPCLLILLSRSPHIVRPPKVIREHLRRTESDRPFIRVFVDSSVLRPRTSVTLLRVRT